jgi:hypothetical protein
MPAISGSAPQDEGSIHPSYEWIRLGGTFSMDQKWLRGGFRAVPDVPSCCPEFATATDLSIGGGILIEAPVSPRWSVGTRLTIAQLGGDFTSMEQALVYANELQSVPASIEHVRKPRMTTMMFEPNITYNPYDALTVGLGVQVGFALSTSFNQSEQLVSPDNIVFENGTRTRLVTSGSISRHNAFQAAVVGRIGYEFVLDEIGQITLGPELSYAHALTNVVEEADWSTHALRIGVVFRYSLLEELRP